MEREPVAVRLFEAHEWPCYRDLRLRALADSPDAFASTFAEEKDRSDADWSERIAASATSPSEFPALAERGGRAVGLAYGRLAPEDPERAHLYSMWVDPAHRRSGVGRALVDAVVAWARTAGARRLLLQVTEGNAPAERLYERAGLARTDERTPLRAGSPLFVCTFEIEL